MHLEKDHQKNGLNNKKNIPPPPPPAKNTTQCGCCPACREYIEQNVRKYKNK